MFDSATTKLLQEKLPSLPQMVMEKTLRSDTDDLVEAIMPRMKIAVVDDKHTAIAYGDEIFCAFADKQGATHVTLNAQPVANELTVEYVRKRTQACDALIAVGSGTVNDLCKRASFLDGKPYIVFPTAASMNGYCSANASIEKDGYKETVPAHVPLGVFCDVGVIAFAPPRLGKSGLGDSLARPTAQADWLLSHLLIGTAYDETPYTLLKPLEDELFSHARGIALQDNDSMKLLMQVLLLSGLGMTIAGGSYPASQGEHMIAHAYGMLLGVAKDRMPTLHGEEISVTALGMARRQEIIIGDTPQFLSLDFNKDDIEKLYGEPVAKAAEKAFTAKREQVDKWGRKIGDWGAIAHRIQPVMMSADKMEAILRAAEAPLAPGDIGWEFSHYIEASRTARFLRDRFTFLDLA